MKIATIKAPRHGFKITDTSPENIKAVEAYLRSVNGKAEQHTTNGFWSIEGLATGAEADLERARVPKTARPGCQAYQCDGGIGVMSYKYEITVTGLSLKRFREGWRLMSAHRTTSRPLERSIFTVRIPEQYIEEMKRKAVKGFRPLPKKVTKVPAAPQPATDLAAA